MAVVLVGVVVVVLLLGDSLCLDLLGDLLLRLDSSSRSRLFLLLFLDWGVLCVWCSLTNKTEMVALLSLSFHSKEGL
jgi:hypothetical protein